MVIFKQRLIILMVDGKNSPLHEEHVRFSTPISPKQQKLIYY